MFRRRGRPPHPGPLTPAEARVLELVRAGLPNAEIAVRLEVSINTVRFHVSNLLAKAGVQSREGLVDWHPRPRPDGDRRWFALPSLVNGLKLAGVGVGAMAVAAAAVVAVAVSQDDSDSARELVSLEACPITIPGEPYLAREPHLPQPPDYYHSVWYGNDGLWTMLDPAGASLDEKTWWWSRDFNIEAGREPLIVVTGTRLDAPGSFISGNPGTHAYADFGTAMLVGIDIPAAGCWEIRAQYKGTELAYVARVGGSRISDATIAPIPVLARIAPNTPVLAPGTGGVLAFEGKCIYIDSDTEGRYLLVFPESVGTWDAPTGRLEINGVHYPEGAAASSGGLGLPLGGLVGLPQPASFWSVPPDPSCYATKATFVSR